ncbi:MAG: hypothetical protein U0903_03850 [Planctomycetales bacterium]
MTFDLQVLLPDGLLLQDQATGLQSADATGKFGILPGAEAFVTLLSPGILSYQDQRGREHFLAVDGGVMLVEKNKVRITTRDATQADSLENLTAAAAEMLQGKQFAERQARLEFSGLQTILLRELRRAEKKR